MDRPDEATAYQLVEDLARDSLWGEGDIVRLAEDLSGAYGLRVTEACRVVAQAIARGDLVAVWMDRTPPALGRATGTAAGPRALSELMDPEPFARPAEPVAADAADELTWVSFEVVDDEGLRADGTFRIALDADVRDGELIRDQHRYDELRPAADVRLKVETAWWDPSAPVVVLGSDEPANAPAVTLRFEVVDDEGEPVAGRYVLEGADGQLAAGRVDGDVRVEIPGGSPATLSLDFSSSASGTAS